MNTTTATRRRLSLLIVALAVFTALFAAPAGPAEAAYINGVVVQQLEFVMTTPNVYFTRLTVNGTNQYYAPTTWRSEWFTGTAWTQRHRTTNWWWQPYPTTVDYWLSNGTHWECSFFWNGYIWENWKTISMTSAGGISGTQLFSPSCRRI